VGLIRRLVGRKTDIPVEAQCIFFISNSLRVGVAGESSEDILFLNHHLHGFGPMKKSVTYMSAVSMVMKNYVEYRRSDAMSSRLELARQLLEVKQKQKWVELVKNSGARKVLEAMYIKLVACEQIIGLESEFIDQFRSLVYFMAELFEEICCHGTIEDDIESFFCIRDLARLLIFEFCWEESRGNAFLLQIKDDRSFASKFVFFSWCNELHNRSAEILLKSFSPHFFAARDFCMLNHMLTDVFFHADKISCDVLSSWMDDFNKISADLLCNSLHHEKNTNFEAKLLSSLICKRKALPRDSSQQNSNMSNLAKSLMQKNDSISSSIVPWQQISSNNSAIKYTSDLS
jgi:hypothetical protein